MDVVTLTIAVIGLALSCLSLGWQAASFLLSGGRVKVKLQRGVRGTHGAIVWEPRRFDPEMAAFTVKQGGLGFPVEEVLAIEVRNVGRLPVSIARWQAILDNGIALYWLDEPLNPRLPYRLDHDSKETWYIRMEEVWRAVRTSQETGLTKAGGARIRMQVELGGGKIVKTKESVLLR